MYTIQPIIDRISIVYPVWTQMVKIKGSFRLFCGSFSFTYFPFRPK